ncbi:MAG TPA: TIGR02679 family protein [Propionibacteriaceae bacterium]|nr:TIGR02679 family protein [Propionibacteriaceae bacterium]
MTDLDRLHRVFAGEDTRWLLERARRRLEKGEPLSGTIALSNPTIEQRIALERLLGRRPGRGTTLSVAVNEVDEVIRRGGIHDEGLKGVVEVITGPVVLLSAVAAAELARRDRTLAPLDDLIQTRSEYAEWATDPRTRSLVLRLLPDPETVVQLVRVLSALPAEGLTLARFAATTAGNPHDLDVGRPLATLAESAISTVWCPSADTEIGRAQRRRALWDSVGVLLDELSSTALCLNLTAAAGTRLNRLTEPARELGEPLLLTMRQLGRDKLSFHDDHVFVCENPAVVAAAADALGSHCPPLICLNGQPSTAALRLVKAVHDSGANLRYHGDFDWGGIRIANLLLSRIPWKPWRFRTEDYERAADHASAPVAGLPVPARWDPALHDALLRRGVRVHEELVLSDLIADLAERSMR